MAAVRERPLPDRVNPLMVGPDAPSYEELVDRRRLGQTDLVVKNSQVGTSSATQPENLGKFDYLHLRVNIPETKNGIWGNRGSPTSYFLMRRSSDGYISATGMFKSAFPFSAAEDEEAERRYILSLPTTSSDQTAGNVWIPPTRALELAEEYGIIEWIRAMLDNKKIETNQAFRDQLRKPISPPPKFFLPQAFLAPTSTRTTRLRRSASPKKVASPRKTVATPRRGRASKASSMESHTKAANKSLQQALRQAATVADTDISTPEPSEPRGSESPEKKGTAEEPDSEEKEAETEQLDAEATVTVTVDNTVRVKDEVETTDTHIEVAMPAGFPGHPLPEDGAAMIAKAKEMVDAAIAQDTAALKAANVEESLPKRGKRKVEEEEEDESGEASGSGAPVAKKAKIERELRKEKVKTRALIGISATLAVGAMIPYLSALF